MSLTLNEALAIFGPTTEDLEVIKENTAENLLYDLSKIARPTAKAGTTLRYVQDARYELETKRIVEPRQRLLKRIIAKQEHLANPYRPRGGVDDHQIEAAREFPIEELFDTQLFNGGQGRKVGRCPFHAGNTGGQERTPSFYIFADNRYKCFGCQEYGSSIDYYMKINNCSFIVAVRALSK